MRTDREKDISAGPVSAELFTAHNKMCMNDTCMNSHMNTFIGLFPPLTQQIDSVLRQFFAVKRPVQYSVWRKR